MLKPVLLIFCLFSFSLWACSPKIKFALGEYENTHSRLLLNINGAFTYTHTPQPLERFDTYGKWKIQQDTLLLFCDSTQYNGKTAHTRKVVNRYFLVKKEKLLTLILSKATIRENGYSKYYTRKKIHKIARIQCLNKKP